MQSKAFPWQGAATALLAAALVFICSSGAAVAGTTGNITGTVTDAAGKPVADVKVTAASLSQTATGTTDAKGFYSLVNLIPDTYTVSFQKTGYLASSLAGITVVQDQTTTTNEQLQTTLKTIASVHATGGSNLVKSNEGSDVYNVTGQELTAATNPVDTHETLYQYLAVTPGVTANGFPAQPRIRGGQVTDLGYEFEGIPIQDRIVGFFTSNLANIGLSNVEVYSGGLPASGSMNGTGYFNSVLKTGTYPAVTQVSIQASSPEFNNYLTVERSWATPDHRFSYYIGFDGVNSQNQYGYGQHTFPDVLYWDYNGPGPVKTRDWVGNFHYRPDPKDDIQVVATNSLGEFVFNYLAVKSPGEPPTLGFLPCPGATPGGNSFTGATGGTAPNGQACTDTGLYWGALSNGTGGNIYHHYGGLGKVQWNHNLNDHSFFNVRIAENFNQYIFDQPMAEVNDPILENPGGPYSGIGYGLAPGTCPLYPYKPGAPVASTNDSPLPAGGSDICAFDDGVNNFYGDRRSNIFVAGLDYVNAINSNLTVKAGLSGERDNNVFEYYLTNKYTTLPSGSLAWPNLDEKSTYPTSRQELYGEADIHVGKFLLVPGLAYGAMHYGYPADAGYSGVLVNNVPSVVASGGLTSHVLNPTFNGTYTFDPNDVLRFSYGNTASFISSAYVYTSSEGDVRRNPFAPGTSYQPQINHSADMMFEHNFGNNTTVRFGPWYNKTSNYLESFQPIIGYTPPGCIPGTLGCVPKLAKTSILTNNNEHNAFGLEFALNHVNTEPRGTSFWLTGTYDNFWTSAFDISGAFINSPLPPNLLAQGLRVRSASNPLFSGTLVADYHSGRAHIDPLIYYQGDTFFNTGDIQTKLNGVAVAPYVASNRLIAHGWWRVNLTVYEELGPKRNLLLGFKADNLLDQVTDTAPCPSNGTGCFPFDGPQSGIVDTPSAYPNQNWIYENYSQSPRTFYFFLGVKM